MEREAEAQQILRCKYRLVHTKMELACVPDPDVLTLPASASASAPASAFRETSNSGRIHAMLCRARMAMY